MPELKLLKETLVARIVAERDRLAFALFLGAGASKSSGVVLASEMIAEWRELAWRDACETGIGFADWCEKQELFKKDDEYSQLFEAVYHDSRSRQRYIEDKIKDAFPGWGYLYLANIVQHGRFNVIFTTNFDDLVNEALTVFLAYNAVVCAADSEVATINLTSERAKIVKLHGDYLFESFMKNTKRELQQLATNMERKFEQFAVENGLIVIGYAGRDESIMGVLEKVMKEPGTFPHGIYWGVRPGDEIAARVSKLASDYPERFHLFKCSDFDYFMACLHDKCGGGTAANAVPLELPDTIVAPYQALEERYRRLLSAAGPGSLDTTRKHIARLEEELRRPWAKAKADDFDLLQAQIALGRRDYKAALQVIEPFAAKHPRNADGLTAWGNALHIRAEEEGSDALADEAVAKWKEAIRLDPASLQPRYSLGRYYALKQRTTEGIAVFEELLRLVPNDIGLRRSLVQLYGTASRYEEAETQLAWLLQREPNSADLHAMRAVLLEQRGLVPEAIEELRIALRLTPQNPWLHCALAGGLAKTNRSEEAAVALEEAIRLDSRNLNFRIQIASVYAMRQQPALALPHLQHAVAIGPNSAEAHGWLCQIMLALGNHAVAQMEGEEAARLSPRDSRIRIAAGTAAQQTGNFSQAENHFTLAAQLNPNAPEAYVALCWLYLTQNRMADLNAAMQRLGQINPQIAQMMQTQMQQAQRMQQGIPGQNWIGALQDQLRTWVQGDTPVGSPPLPSAQGQPPPLPNIWGQPR